MHDTENCNDPGCDICSQIKNSQPLEAEALAFAQSQKPAEAEPTTPTADLSVKSNLGKKGKKMIPARLHSNSKPWGISDPVHGKFMVTRPVRRAATDVATAARKSGITDKNVFISALMQTLDQPVETEVPLTPAFTRTVKQYMKIAKNSGLSHAQSLLVLAKPEL